MKKKLFLLIGLGLVILLAYNLFFSDTSDSNNSLSQNVVLSGVVSDVTGGIARGDISAVFDGSEYELSSEFSNLPDPEGTDFYEGWVVRRGLNFDVVSTGKAVKNGEVYTNDYSSIEDLSGHTHYVLTIEPDDGNPAPADHVLEGDFVIQE